MPPLSRRSRAWLAFVAMAPLIFAGSETFAAAAKTKVKPPVPISPSDCSLIASRMGDALGLRLTGANADFTDPATSLPGQACHITGQGRSNKLFDIDNAARALVVGMSGWKRDPMLDADGPDGAVRTFKRPKQTAILSVTWSAPPGVCRDDEPIASCDIKPSQRIWSFSGDAFQL
ncbi:hypothetical protein [Segnochrobactrum spirostomi]|uniref:DUF3558 domain-containing protein n=1 Tax=Segnochrobactrum spirostomi TaxID=2608987 RepID=A0A6A7XYX8_9HYPH|nr:hypothetical protein [Segnochrobactrum spirostomi]MQT11980.1 hypothetical protein [Segnochrobactrum spirostomi]